MGWDHERALETVYNRTINVEILKYMRAIWSSGLAERHDPSNTAERYDHLNTASTYLGMKMELPSHDA